MLIVQTSTSLCQTEGVIWNISPRGSTEFDFLRNGMEIRLPNNLTKGDQVTRPVKYGDHLTTSGSTEIEFTSKRKVQAKYSFNETEMPAQANLTINKDGLIKGVIKVNGKNIDLVGYESAAIGLQCCTNHDPDFHCCVGDECTQEQFSGCTF